MEGRLLFQIFQNVSIKYKLYHFKFYYLILLPIFDSNNNCLYNKFLFSLPTSQSTIIIVFVKKILLILGLTGSNFDPLGEFVDGDQQVCEAPGCLLQATDEIQTPHRKQPSDRYCL
jgi:hypothetical protein